MDVMTLFVDAIIIASCFFWVGFFLGGLMAGWRFVQRWVERRSLPSSAPVCTCKHGFSNHKNGGKCQHAIGGFPYWCTCTVYVGPDPILSGLWTPSKTFKE